MANETSHSLDETQGRTALSRKRCCSAVKGRLRLPCVEDWIACGLASVLGGAAEVVMTALDIRGEIVERTLVAARRGAPYRRHSIVEVVRGNRSIVVNMLDACMRLHFSMTTALDSRLIPLARHKSPCAWTNLQKF